MPRFFVLDGKDLGRSFDLGEGDTLGRDPSCAATLRDASVSREHARLERDGARWVLVDLGSRNGLRAGGERVPRLVLEDDVEVVLGRLPLRVRLAPDGPATPRADATAAPAEPPLETVDVPPRREAPAPVRRDGPVLEEEIELGDGPSGEPVRSASPGPERPAPSERERARLELLRPPPRRAGLFGSDLSQLPAATRWALYLLVLAVGAGLVYGAFLLATYLRTR